MKEHGLEVVCSDCEGPLTPEELAENDGQCDLCHDFAVGTFSLSDMLDERANRLAQIAAIVGRTETVGGNVYHLILYEHLKTELRRIVATMRYVRQQMEHDDHV